MSTSHSSDLLKLYYQQKSLFALAGVTKFFQRISKGKLVFYLLKLMTLKMKDGKQAKQLSKLAHGNLAL